MNRFPAVILASASPRRRQLLAEADIDFEVKPADIVETRHDGENVEHYVLRMAREKAKAVSCENPGRIVIAADTVVALDNEVFGKPGDLAEARRFLKTLSGRCHHVLTGVAIVFEDGRLDNWLCRSDVWFKQLDDVRIGEYLEKVNPLDKAGAYAIQQHGEMIVEKVEGLLSNIIGLPVEEVLERLGEVGGLG